MQAEFLAENARNIFSQNQKGADGSYSMYRHEYKYLVSAAQIPVLQSRIAGLMSPDANAGEDGQYRIRSLYFDDAQDRCLRDNEIGVDRKAKYRIRIYNGSDARIQLELKEGLRGKKLKTSDPLTREIADRLIAGDYLRGLANPGDCHNAMRPGGSGAFAYSGESDAFASPGGSHSAMRPGGSDAFEDSVASGSVDSVGSSSERSVGSDALERSGRIDALEHSGRSSSTVPTDTHYQVLPGFCADMMINRMHPAVIVEYDRTPFVYRYGNVRVTFDRNISSSQDFEHFFCPHIHRRPIMPAGMHLMEVKFDEFLPDVIYRALQLEQLRQTTFSKYYLCRIYGGVS